MKSPPTLVLASTSPYRRQLLARLDIPFECRPSGIDETPFAGEKGCALAARLARAKAQAVAVDNPGAWIIGSDQVAVRRADTGGESILGKPGSAANCIEQLLACSGRTLMFITAVAVMRRQCESLSEFVELTKVRFRPLQRAAVERYVARESPLDCAGGFKSEGLGISLCETIEGSDPSALIGLPLIRLSAIMRTAGFAIP